MIVIDVVAGIGMIVRNLCVHHVAASATVGVSFLFAKNEDQYGVYLHNKYVHKQMYNGTRDVVSKQCVRKQCVRKQCVRKQDGASGDSLPIQHCRTGWLSIRCTKKQTSKFLFISFYCERFAHIMLLEQKKAVEMIKAV